MIYVTHDQVEAMTMADRIVLLRDGAIEQVGRPLDLYNKPANRFVAGFLGSPKMNFFDAKVAEYKDETVVLDIGGERVSLPASSFLAGVPEIGQVLVAGIRPEHFFLVRGDTSPSCPRFGCEIMLEERLGRETVLHARSDRLVPNTEDQHYIVIHRNVQSELTAGEHVEIGFDPASACIFAGSGHAIRWPTADKRN